MDIKQLGWNCAALHSFFGDWPVHVSIGVPILMSAITSSTPIRSLYRKMNIMERKVSFRPANNAHGERFLQSYLRYKFHAPTIPSDTVKSINLAQQYLDYRNALHGYTVRPILCRKLFLSALSSLVVLFLDRMPLKLVEYSELHLFGELHPYYGQSNGACIDLVSET